VYTSVPETPEKRTNQHTHIHGDRQAIFESWIELVASFCRNNRLNEEDLRVDGVAVNLSDCVATVLRANVT
jgi:hypothetical protein